MEITEIAGKDRDPLNYLRYELLALGKDESFRKILRCGEGGQGNKETDLKSR